jgi:hypothetical protein
MKDWTQLYPNYWVHNKSGWIVRDYEEGWVILDSREMMISCEWKDCMEDCMEEAERIMYI